MVGRVRFVIHEAASTHVALDQRLGLQYFIRGRHCRSIQSKLASQFSGRWQTLAVNEHASPYQVSNLVGKLPINGNG